MKKSTWGHHAKPIYLNCGIYTIDLPLNCLYLSISLSCILYLLSICARSMCSGKTSLLPNYEQSEGYQWRWRWCRILYAHQCIFRYILNTKRSSTIVQPFTEDGRIRGDIERIRGGGGEIEKGRQTEKY